MTKILLADDFTSFGHEAATPRGPGVWAGRLDGAANLIGALVLFPGVLLGAVMFVIQSL